MNNGSTSLSASRTHPIAGQYSSPHDLIFKPSPPQQYGVSQPIPNSHVGITAQRVFSKINKALTPGPIAKIVIKIQQARF